jgi:cell wall-associated NlpC family hydrolase
MGNLKHTAVAAIAVVMISSMVSVQAAGFTSANAEKNQKNVLMTSVTDVDTSNKENTPVLENAKVWSDELIRPDVRLAVSDVLEESLSYQISVKDKTGYVLTTDSALNVRTGASTDAEIVDQMKCGSPVTIMETEGDFYKITYDNKTGYVSKSAITFSEEAAKEAAEKALNYKTGTVVIAEGALNVRNGAGDVFEVVDQLDNGEKVTIIEEDNGWFLVYYGNDYKVGYVLSTTISVDGTVSKEEIAKKIADKTARDAISNGTISVAEGTVNVRVTPSENADITVQLDNGTKVLIMEVSNGWTKIAYGQLNTIGYVKSDYVKDASQSAQPSATVAAKTSAKVATGKSSGEKKAPAPATSKGQEIVTIAQKYLGVPYVYGGSSPSGFDCSGLVQYVCRQAGISVSRTSSSQFGNGTAVSRDELQPGDLVFFKSGGRISHVGIYAGNGQMIHSPQTGKTVSYSSINTPGRQASFAGARRVY